MAICGVSPAAGRSFVACALKRFGAQASLRRSLRKDFRSPRQRDFEKLNLHLAVFEQPAKDNYFGLLLIVAHPFLKDIFFCPLDISLDLADEISG